MPVSVLPQLLALAACVAVVSASFVVVALKKGRSRMLWIALGAFLFSAGGGYASYSRLERIHSELFISRVSVKTKQELLARLGAPSRRESYDDHGKEVEVLYYEITLLQPPVHVQFQFQADKWIATFSTNL